MLFDICIMRLGFFAFIASVISSYFYKYYAYSFLIRSYLYCIESLTCCYDDLKKSNSKIESSRNYAFLMMSRRPSFSEKTVNTAMNFVYSFWFFSFWKVLMTTSGYYLKSMNMFWFYFILLNSQSEQLNRKLK